MGRTSAKQRYRASPQHLRGKGQPHTHLCARHMYRAYCSPSSQVKPRLEGDCTKGSYTGKELKENWKDALGLQDAVLYDLICSGESEPINYSVGRTDLDKA